MALSKALKNLFKEHQAGRRKAQKMADSRVQEALEGLLDWMMAHDAAFHLSAPTPAGGARSATVTCKLEDADGVLDPWNCSSHVTLSITGGTASGKKLNGGTSPVVLTMDEGLTTALASATSTGTLILGLSAPSPAGLDATATLTITFS